MVKFQCSQCGECCKHINLIPQLTNFDNGFGICIHLKDNKCSIYEKRPEICRVDVMYEKYFADQFSREEFYHLNGKVCERLKELRG